MLREIQKTFILDPPNTENHHHLNESFVRDPKYQQNYNVTAYNFFKNEDCCFDNNVVPEMSMGYVGNIN